MASKKRSPSVSLKSSNAKSEKSSTSKSANDLSETFEFYARIVKLRILRHDDADVVSKYSMWLLALRKHPDPVLRCDYVRLLLMGLNYPEPAVPFVDYPPDVISPADGGDWRTMARTIFRRDDRSRRPNPPVLTAVSDDKCQFAASQTDARMLQCFYARSDEPLHMWSFKPNSPSKPPADDPVHAIPLDWERSLAGLRKVRDEPAAASRIITANEDHCRKIMETYQEILNMGAAKFKWNDKSLLTGDTIPGSDLCIDWSIHEHENVQLEIDEEMVRAFDKIYPDNFRLEAAPELMEGIVKRMDTAEQNARIMAKDCAQCLLESCSPRQCAGKDLRDSTKEEGDALRMSVIQEEDSEPCGGQNMESTEKYEYCHRPRSAIERRREHYANETCLQVELPSYAGFDESVNSIVNEAEKLIRGVNDWLSVKEHRRE